MAKTPEDALSAAQSAAVQVARLSDRPHDDAPTPDRRHGRRHDDQPPTTSAARPDAGRARERPGTAAAAARPSRRGRARAVGGLGLPGPGRDLPRRLLRLSALPQRRPAPARLHRALVRPGRRALHRPGQLPAGPRRPDVRAGAASTPWSSPGSRSSSSTPSAWRWRCSSPSTSGCRPRCAALFLVPWLLPLIVSASTWSWMLNSESGVVNTALAWLGIGPVNWLTSPSWSLASVTIANIWIGIPFNLVVLYSGLQAIPADALRGGRARRGERLAAVLARSPSRCCARSRRSRCCSGWSTRSRSSTSSGS